MDYTVFRTNLKSLIDSRGKYAKEVADELGMTHATLSRYLNGVRNPEMSYVIKIAKTFGVSIDWLLGLDNDKGAKYPYEIKEVADLYSLASNDDRNVIQAVLEKYRGKA